jgi:membrane protein YdbS with pleckstrin-like domain
MRRAGAKNISEKAKFHRAQVIEITYFSVLVAAALLIISFFVDPDWAWFLRGGIGGLVLTFLYVWGRVALYVWRREAHRSFS